MGLRSYFGFGEPDARAQTVEDRALTRQSVPQSMLASPPSGQATPSRALEIADVWACVRVLADAAGSLPLHVYRRRDDGRQRLDNATAGLLRAPAPATTTAGLIGQMMVHLLTHGNAYLGLFRGPAGRVEQLGLLAPDRVAPEIRAGRPSYVLTGLKGERTRHDESDILHVKGLSADGLVGMSPIRQCRVALGLSDTLVKHAAGLFENQAVPRGLLKLQRFGDADAQVAELRKGWEGTRDPSDPDPVSQFGTHRGPANAHRIAVVSGEVDFLPISMPLDDLEFLQLRKLSAVEVARIIGVPPWMIGADSGESMTYSNTSEQARAFVTFSLRPWLVRIEQALSASRDLFGPRDYCTFEVDGLLRADPKTRGEVHARALDPVVGWMSREEVRRLEDLPAEPEPQQTPAQAVAAMVDTPANGNAPAPVS